MTNSIKVFSFLHNCKLCFNQGKKIDINKTVNTIHFGRQKKYVVDMCSKIVGSIKNNHFKFYEFKIYILYMYMFNDKVHLSDIVLDDVLNMSKLFTNYKYLQDKTFIDMLIKTKGLELDILDLYRVNADGNNILLGLILSDTISPIYYIIQYDKSKGCFDKPDYDVSDKLNRINKRTEIIKTILRR